MASSSNGKRIEKLFIKESRNLPEDKDLRNNAILNNFRSEHGRIMNEHATEYTELLRAYIANSKSSAKQKKWFKTTFFLVSIAMLVCSFLLFGLISIKLMEKEWKSIDVTALAGLISSLVGLLSLYIVIPEIIARYLFNQKEDEDMTKIVESVQNYDEKVFNSMNAYSLGESLEQRGGMNAMLKLKKEAENSDDNNGPKGDV